MKLLELLSQQFVIPVIRHTHEEDLYSLCMALAEGGLNILEVTLMSESAFPVIERLSQQSDIIVGAGTIVNEDQIQRALEVGSQFLVSPGLDESLVKKALIHKATYIPGVLTPSEVMKAQASGLNLVKVFPAGPVGGTDYIQTLKGPFPQMNWMATGGIGLDEINKYREAGVSCIGIGGQITPKELIQKKDWKAITHLVQKYTRPS